MTEDPTLTSVYTEALTMVAIGAVARGVTVILAFVRTFLNRKQFVSFRFGWIEWVTSIEPLLLLVVGAWLFRSIGVSEFPTVSRTIAAVIGAGLVVIGWGVIIWTFISWPSIFAGHGVLHDHRLITTGAYGVVRHPVYLGAILIWVGLALAFTHVVTFALAGLYVIPTYVLYLRSEEAMMLVRFGDQYRDYQDRVPSLVPRLVRQKPPRVSA
jgi:protein-S-isoprenylcysteine O-methyltransferase Ste14